jgi:uncharacterized repeat protein (TIGR03803 family)
MKNLALYGLSISAASALLAGCAGSQPPIGAPSRLAAAASSVAYKVIYSFKGEADGATPRAALINVNGTLYGTTYAGGRTGCAGPARCGTVFSITPSGTEKVLHAFAAGTSDGSLPVASLVDVKGTLYGTTQSGGANKYDGTVFAITTSGAESVLHSFGGKGDGVDPTADLVLVNNVLYGTTSGGGDATYGTVFTITSRGKERVLYSFRRPPDARNPVAGLLNDHGTLYGTTEGGGSYHKGAVFTITPSGTEAVLYSFKSQDDGAYSLASLVKVKGILYGSTDFGGREAHGTIFSITTGGTETVLHEFRVGVPDDGKNPQDNLIDVNGTLYGTTGGGGTSDAGTIFSITTSGKETVLHSFTGTSGDGAYPVAGLVNVNGTLYGTTWRGGTNGNGTVFALTL